MMVVQANTAIGYCQTNGGGIIGAMNAIFAPGNQVKGQPAAAQNAPGVDFFLQNPKVSLGSWCLGFANSDGINCQGFAILQQV